MIDAMSEERWKEIQSLKYATEHLNNDKLSAMTSDMIAEVERLQKENKKLHQNLVSSFALEAAWECMGVYAAAVKGGNNPYDKRTEYMEGWNAYSSELLDKWCLISSWVRKLPVEVKRDIEEYLLNETLSLHVRDNKVSLYVNCNDLFYWACADAEPFEMTDLPDLKQAIIDSPNHGVSLWCCRKRGMRPQSPCYKNFSDSDKKFFDAAGPERKDNGG